MKLETAFKQIQEQKENMKQEFKEKYLSYPTPKTIIEEWEEIK